MVENKNNTIKITPYPKGFYLVKVKADEFHGLGVHYEPAYYNGEIDGWEFCGQDAVNIDLEEIKPLDIIPMELPEIPE